MVRQSPRLTIQEDLSIEAAPYRAHYRNLRQNVKVYTQLYVSFLNSSIVETTTRVGVIRLGSARLSNGEYRMKTELPIVGLIHPINLVIADDKKAIPNPRTPWNFHNQITFIIPLQWLAILKHAEILLKRNLQPVYIPCCSKLSVT